MILFRADGNSLIGLGHVMRCLSIADAFKQTGYGCLFVTADNELHMTIKERGYNNLVLDSQYDCMDNEMETFKEEIEKRDVQIVFVDSYYVTDRYLRGLWQFCSKKHITLVYIDDVLAFPYQCDVLLNYNIYADEECYKKLYGGLAEPKFLINTSYMPIRAEFQNLPERKIKECANNILISTGGADAEHIGLEIIKAIISHKEWINYKFHFIVGMMNKDKYEICALAESHDNIILYKNVKKMSEIMQSCDVAISAAGSTLYELCSTQTPSITYILADNQIAGANGFEKKGVLKCVGDIREIVAKEIAAKVIKEAIQLAVNYEERVSIATKMKSIIDGKGAARVVKEVFEVWSQD